ncbi:aminopeptidase [Gorillibacterium timonense]|uniref:aminopeptidase n=1 Tax=Gorillibacterium timonense TaxID=1689269 RepID=UPI00071D9771|nr:aminopeptidase [Gorillibacterium timonense]
MNKMLIANLVKSMELKREDIVLVQLWGENEQLGTLDDFCVEIASWGAAFIKLQHSRLLYKDIFERTPEDADCYTEDYFKVFEPVTVVIDLMAYQPAVPHPDFPITKMNSYKRYMRSLMTALASKETFIQLRLPTIEMAMESGVAYPKFSRMLENAYAVDYDDLKDRCETAISRFKGTKSIEIVTDNQHTLTLSVEGREWYKDAGNGDFPSGEVYIAPLEASAKGSLFMKEAFFEGTSYRELILVFSDGILASTNHDDLNDVIEQLPERANVLCEFGIGLNLNIDELTGFPVFDEKAYGTCHIGLGMNSLFGGQNHCAYHTDIVFKGDVSIDGKRVVSNGELVDEWIEKHNEQERLKLMPSSSHYSGISM